MQDGGFYMAGATAAVGSVIGTALKMLRSPPVSAGYFVLQSFTAITVGTFVGGVAYEYFQLGPWVVSAMAATAGYISDEILRFIELYGRRVKEGKGISIDIGLGNTKGRPAPSMDVEVEVTEPEPEPEPPKPAKKGRKPRGS
jgi:hypothetical protein